MWINYTRRIITLICCSFSYPCIFCFSDLFLPVPRKVNLFLTKMVFEGRATTQTKNAKVTKKKNHFLFQKGFFLSTIFWKDTRFRFSKGKLVSWPSLQKLWEGIPGAENLCTFLFTPFRRDTRKGAGKGYQVRKPCVVSLPSKIVFEKIQPFK